MASDEKLLTSEKQNKHGNNSNGESLPQLTMNVDICGQNGCNVATLLRCSKCKKSVCQFHLIMVSFRICGKCRMKCGLPILCLACGKSECSKAMLYCICLLALFLTAFMMGLTAENDYNTFMIAAVGICVILNMLYS